MRKKQTGPRTPWGSITMYSFASTKTLGLLFLSPPLPWTLPLLPPSVLGHDALSVKGVLEPPCLRPLINWSDEPLGLSEVVSPSIK